MGACHWLMGDLLHFHIRHPSRARSQSSLSLLFSLKFFTSALSSSSARSLPLDSYPRGPPLWPPLPPPFASRKLSSSLFASSAFCVSSLPFFSFSGSIPRVSPRRSSSVLPPRLELSA